AVSGGTVANANLGGVDLVVGSNWYGAGNAAPAASAGVLIAAATTTNPVGSPTCGTRMPSGIAVAAGDGQSAAVTEAFGQALQARVLDQCGGAVAAHTVTFTAPGAGASATLSPASSATDYNGIA